jgi:small conductance mechanosensitive channel
LDINAILSGVTIGAITFGGVLKGLALILIGMILIRVIMKIVDTALDKAKNLSSLRVYIRSVVRIMLYFLLVLTVAPAFGINVTSLIALLSVAGLAVSLALQNTLSNLAGGIMVLLSKPFEVGDFIESEGISGTVAGVDLAYTTIVTVDNKEVFVPNSHISAAKIINYNRLGKRRVDLNFTASYDAPTATVKKAIQEVVDAQSSMILTDPAPVVLLSAYLNSSIQYTVRVWVDAADYWTVYGNINEGVRESFARHNVEMTYEHVNVHLVKE